MVGRVGRPAGRHFFSPDGPLGTVVSHGKFTHRWTFDGGKLIYVETLIEGARRLIVTV